MLVVLNLRYHPGESFLSGDIVAFRDSNDVASFRPFGMDAELAFFNAAPLKYDALAPFRPSRVGRANTADKKG